MISTVALPVLFGVLIIALWQGQVLHKIFHTDVNTLPLPSRICKIILENIPAFFQNALYTVIVALAGLIIGSVIGYLIAVLAALFQKWGAGGLTIVGAFNAIPIVALAPVLSNWTKDVSCDPNIRSMVAKTLVTANANIPTTNVNLDTLAFNSFNFKIKITGYGIKNDSSVGGGNLTELSGDTLADVKSTILVGLGTTAES